MSLVTPGLALDMVQRIYKNAHFMLDFIFMLGVHECSGIFRQDMLVLLVLCKLDQPQGQDFAPSALLYLRLVLLLCCWNRVFFLCRGNRAASTSIS